MRTLWRSVAPLLTLTLLLAGPAAADAPAGDQTVPDVVGLDISKAQGMLTAAGFAFEVVRVEGEPSNLVVGQDPGGLALRPTDITVQIMVPGRETPAPTPPARTAPPAIEPPPVAPPEEPPPAEPAPVESLPVAPPTGPPSGDAPPSGSLPVAPPLTESPPPTVVPAPAPTGPQEPTLPDLSSLHAEPGPDLSGPALPSTFSLSREEAERKLAGYQLLMEVTLTSADMQGRVVEQIPVPGTNLALGQTVTLVFGLADEPGREYRQVPALEGLTPEQALAKLTKQGYTAAWCTVPSANDRAGLVVDSTPRRFSFLLKGEAVRVRIGRGTGEVLPPPAKESRPTPGAPNGDEPPSGSLPPTGTPVEPPPAAPVEPPLTVPVEPPPPAEPPPAPPAEPPPAPPVEPPPAPPQEPPAPAPAEPAPTPFLPQPNRPAPGPTKLTGPADSDSFPKAYGPTFEWLTVPNADGYEWELEEEIPGGWRASRNEKLIGTKFRPARMEAGRYRWRVRALNGDVPGSWAEYRLLFLY